jgi:hypothetical protein
MPLVVHHLQALGESVPAPISGKAGLRPETLATVSNSET